MIFVPRGPAVLVGDATMPQTITITDELKQRIDTYIEEDETYEEFFEELVRIYESEGRFLQEGYSE